MTLHEDAGPFTKKSSANCLSIAPVLGEGNEKLKHFLCASYVKRNRDADVDNSAMWRTLLADLEALASGVVDGLPIAPVAPGSDDMWRVVVVFAKADEQVRCDDWGLTHYNASHEVCSECLANRTDKPWTDMRAAASWRGTEQMSAAQYQARARAPLHPLVTSTLFWRFFFVLDAMHILDCKGVAATIFGSVLGMLVRDRRLGPNQQSRIGSVNQRLLAWYALHPGSHRLPHLTLQSIVNKGGWHELAGPAVKAANTRGSAPFFASLARAYWEDADPLGRAVRRVTATLAEMYALMAESPMFLDDATLARFREIVFDFGIAYQYLRAWAEENRLLMWQVRPKSHKAMHMPLVASVINPRCVSNYADESQIGTTTRVWKGSVTGRYKAHVQRTVLAKRWLAVLLRYERGD